MIDFSSYIQHGPEFERYPPMGDLPFALWEEDDDACTCGICSANEKLRRNQKLHYDNVTTATNWEETQLLICPPRLLGYHLKGKRWVELYVENVRNIEKLKDTTSFDKLELNKPQKNLIRNLVTCHASGSESQDRVMNDLSQGKGNGLVILLHGEGSPWPEINTSLLICRRATGNPYPVHLAAASSVSPQDAWC